MWDATKLLKKGLQVFITQIFKFYFGIMKKRARFVLTQPNYIRNLKYISLKIKIKIFNTNINPSDWMVVRPKRQQH